MLLYHFVQLLFRKDRITPNYSVRKDFLAPLLFYTRQLILQIFHIHKDILQEEIELLDILFQLLLSTFELLFEYFFYILYHTCTWYSNYIMRTCHHYLLPFGSNMKPTLDLLQHLFQAHTLIPNYSVHLQFHILLLLKDNVMPF